MEKSCGEIQTYTNMHQHAPTQHTNPTQTQHTPNSRKQNTPNTHPTHTNPTFVSWDVVQRKVNFFAFFLKKNK